MLYKSNSAYKCFNYPGTGPIFDQGLGITKILPTCIYNMDTLVNLVIPSDVKTIDERGIYYNKNLKSITLPPELTSSLFKRIYANESLEEIHFPEGVNWLYNNRYTNKNKNGEETNCVVDIASESSSVGIVVGTKNMKLDDEFTSADGSFTSKVTTTSSCCCLNSGMEGIIYLPKTIKTLGITSFAFNKKLKGIYFPKEVTLQENNVAFDDTYQSRSVDSKYTPAQFYTPFNDGELPFTSYYLFGGSYRYISSFVGADDNFTIYYQTRDDGKSFAEVHQTFRNALVNGNKGFFKLVEVADSNLTPVQ